MSTTQKLKSPGLRGEYRGTCIACFTPADTALAFQGEAEWLLAGLATFGLTKNEAYNVYRALQAGAGNNLAPGEVRDGIHGMIIRVCAGCAEKCPARFPAPGLLIPGTPLPAVSQEDQAR